jgi:cyclic beta-1,2-glucan synthetase
VRFAILSDFTDADQETQDEDDALLGFAHAQIDALNARHPLTGGEGTRFYLFHRKRLWNAQERKWMGWERKRGKLHEFNRLLRGAQGTSYVPRPGESILRTPVSGVRFVVTLDADTRLPMDSVRQLVGTAAHPLNAARFDTGSGRVVEGYAILQPRISPTLPRRVERSIFRSIFSSAGGIDPYAGAVSNVYQDFFGEGSYTGKGLYDVDAYERALAGRIPENSVLSHDLFESVYARCALLSDVELFEEFPSHAEVAAVRTHRWVRGDWQLVPWALGRKGRGLPVISRWKMIDNLRRSLSAPAALALLVIAWSVPAVTVDAWLGLIVLSLAMPGLLAAVDRLLFEPQGRGMRARVHDAASSLASMLVQVSSQIVFLAHNAWLMSDAIVRTLVRLAVTRRHLLEWVTAAQAKTQASLALGSFNWYLRGGTILVIGASAAVLYFDPQAFRAAAPIVVLWWIAPVVARLISIPSTTGRARQVPDDAERLELRLIARRTWRYFDRFVGPEDNALPPDNVQEDPEPIVAHRSSPTNIGLYLLSTLAARDFGWLGLDDMTTRLEATFAALERLERHRGHFWNWYDTRTLAPLEPRYVSTVDSGNLVAHLLTLAQGCDELCKAPVLDARVLRGTADTLRLLCEALESIPESRRKQTGTATELHGAALGLQEYLHALESAPSVDWPQALATMEARASQVLELASLLGAERIERDGEVLEWARMLRQDLRSHARDLGLRAADGLPAPRLAQRLGLLASAARRYFGATDFAILFDADRWLFSIGARMADGKLVLDTSYYDLLASEARIASFVAIVKRDVTQGHWFRLGRRMTLSDGHPVLMSWSGSMFEYLMPSLVLYAPYGSLLDQSCRGAVSSQIAYGVERGVPWGVSESAFNVRDRELTYQYAAFGVPGMGLKRGLGRQLVVAPYATALAAQYEARAAVANFAKLRRIGALGRFGYYDAVDFTTARTPEGSDFVLVRAFMAHHQGMSLVALDNVVHPGVMRHRFHREPAVQAAELLLQESTAHISPVVVAPVEPEVVEIARAEPPREPVRRLYSVHTAAPVTHLLSNGRYAVMLTAAGSGYSVSNKAAVTRWREDPTRDDWGSFIYLRDADSGTVWSAGHQPTLANPDRYEVRFAEDRARIARTDGPIGCVLEVIVSPEDSVELRRLVLANNGARTREIEITSYSEIVLASGAEDAAHPAFSKLFVETEYFAPARALIARRRPRDPEAAHLWAAHVVALGPGSASEIEYETDRRAFVGRTCSIRAPLAVMDGRPLTNTTGPVLDPIFSLRTRVRLAPDESVGVTFATMTAQSREEIETLADKYHDPAAYERASTLAWTHAQVQLHHLDVSSEQARTFQQLASRVLYSDPALRPGSEFLKTNRLGPSALWRFGISGDRPIVLLRVDSSEDREIVGQLLRAHEFWRSKRLAVDLVILNEKATSYLEDVQVFVETMVNAYAPRLQPGSDAVGSIFVLRADRLSPRERALLACAARAVLVAGQGSVAEQVPQGERPLLNRRRAPPISARTDSSASPAVPPLEFANGLGGFVRDGQEYAIVLAPGKTTPAPWVNVIANPQFGFIVSESGCGYTWSGNSRQNQLTPWSNDPVADSSGEAFYLRDEDSAELWSPTALPIRLDGATYVAYHGQGYSRFEHHSHGIASTLLEFVANEDPVRIARLELRNDSSRRRRIAVCRYLEWQLGANRGAHAHFIVTEVAGGGIVQATNPWNEEFGEAVAVAAIAGGADGWTCDRREFFGRHGSVRQPAALLGSAPLTKRSGAGLDPCCVLQKSVELQPGESASVVLLFGQAPNAPSAAELIARYEKLDVGELFDEVRSQWRSVLATVQVETPERSMDLMLNGWLQYQVLSCRVWARSAFYQAGGAYGFRDQLQDGMALVLAAPAVVREHLLRAAGRQFPEGDVQHWWHPPSGRGVRTHFSDDRLWLPYAVEQYARVSGDKAVLDAEIAFLEGPGLDRSEEAAYFLPTDSASQASLYEHCARAIDASLAVGAHGLPLIGGGDWNDGMNRVGHRGAGESVWLAWFLYATLKSFAPIAQARGDTVRAERWLEHAGKLQAAVEAQAWDGAWYRRAYFDDGTPLGAAANDECRIDAIAQSWGLISGAADRERARRAMESVERHLLRRGDELALLFTPPFDRTVLDPGYIKAYVPGVRENGGQYTHASVWTLIAFTLLKDGDAAVDLFGMLNPLNRGATRTGIHAYRVEPYAVAADVYSSPPHTRLGGWTWYTGAAGWLYRAGLEWILGLRVEADRVRLAPCIPRDWRRYSIRFQHARSTWTIRVDNPDAAMTGIALMEIDGVGQPHGTDSFALGIEGEHQVRVILGE